MVEIEVSVLERRCVNRPIPDAAALQKELAAYEARVTKPKRPSCGLLCRGRAAEVEAALPFNTSVTKN